MWSLHVKHKFANDKWDGSGEGPLSVPVTRGTDGLRGHRRQTRCANGSVIFTYDVLGRVQRQVGFQVGHLPVDGQRGSDKVRSARRCGAFTLDASSPERMSWLVSFSSLRGRSDGIGPHAGALVSIVNSLLIVLFLTVMVAMIMVRNLHWDIVRYNRVLSTKKGGPGGVRRAVSVPSARLVSI